MTSYADTAALMKKQLIPSVVDWEAVEKMLEQWLIVVTVLLRPQESHPEVIELTTVLQGANKVNSCLLLNNLVRSRSRSDILNGCIIKY